jgi:hypothetical protein
MRKVLSLLLIILCFQAVKAERLLGDLDFTQGKWVMVGVSLHNYHPLPIQEQIGTFIMADSYIMKQIQQKWDFEEVFEDYCDYHYALKIYQDGNLVRTFKVNLLCDYISMDGMSYQYSEREFIEFRRYFKPIKWSRIRFRDLDLLKASVIKLDNIPNVYWYGDVKQYNFKGSFSCGIDHLPWNADKDSVIAAFSEQIVKETGREDFYANLKYWLVSEDLEWMDLRLNVYCDEDFFKKYKRNNVITDWRNHFSEQSFVQIVVIGLNQEDYYRAMN